MDFLRIRLIVPGHCYFSYEEGQNLTLNLDQGKLAFRISMFEASFYRIYTFHSNDFNFKLDDEAIQRISDSLYLLCLEFPIGILINPNLKTVWISQSFREEIRLKLGHEIEDDYIGVKIFPSSTGFAGGIPPKVELKSSFMTFEELLNKYYTNGYQKSKNTERLLRAIEIYNSANYLTFINHNAVFILLMSAVEALIEPEDVSMRLQRSVDSFIKLVNKLKIDDEEKNSINGSLSFLKKTSITKSGRLLVGSLLNNNKKYNDFSPEIFFSKAYNLRSKFVHKGFTKTSDLDIRTIQILEFVYDVMKAYFEKYCRID